MDIALAVVAIVMPFGFLLWLFKESWKRGPFWFATAAFFMAHILLVILILTAFRRTPWGLFLILLPIENYAMIWLLEKQVLKSKID